MVNDSAASRNSLVDTALSFSLLTGTSVNDRFKVEKKFCPGPYVVVAIVCIRCSFNGVFMIIS